MPDRPLTVLIVGAGGREHALAWTLAQSPMVERLLFAGAPNAGLMRLAHRAEVAADDHAAVVALCRRERIRLVVIGPEAPLVAGLADDLRGAGIAAFGPSRAAARLESSKAFAKAFCREHKIPTARWAAFTTQETALDHLDAVGAPIVVKADGLAAGKGVVVADTHTDAEVAIRACFAGAFGSAGATVVLEERLTGPEVSVFALSDGETVLPFGTAQDHKRAFDGDRGPNTGGMGAFSPSPLVGPALERAIHDAIIAPTIAGMRAAGTSYVGVLYAGLMLTADGPKVIEFNARFGDPECQVLMPRLASDLAPLLLAAAEGRLAGRALRWSDSAALAVVMATRGYPGTVETGSVIEGVADAEATGALVFHAATRTENDRLVAAGGRVLDVTATGPAIAAARAKAYEAVDRIAWPDGFCRRDIGAPA